MVCFILTATDDSDALDPSLVGDITLDLHTEQINYVNIITPPMDKGLEMSH